MPHDRSHRASEADTPFHHGSSLLSSRRLLLALLLVCLVVLPQAHSQSLPRPRLTTLTPQGARKGTTVEVTLSGTDLDDVTALRFSDPRIQVERIPDPPPPKTKAKGKMPPPPPVRFRVTVPETTPIGVHEVHVLSKRGVSNTRAFCVGECSEVAEKEPNNDTAAPQKVSLDSTINGAIASRTDVDYYAFPGKKGERIVVHCAASSIDSMLNPLVHLIAPSGREMASSRNYRFRDAVLDAELPTDGEYLVRVCNFTYTAGKVDETFYRLTVTTAPWIDSVYPPVVEPGKPATVTVYGRNLPGGTPAPEDPTLERCTVRIDPPARQDADSHPTYSGALLPRTATTPAFAYRIRNGSRASNPVLVSLASSAVVLDASDNNTPDKAQSIRIPCTLCGRIENRRDRDWYTFTAKKGEVYILEAFADRLGAPVDLYFKLRRADTKQLVLESDTNSELPIRIGQLSTYSDDPRGRFVVPQDGTYELMVGSWSPPPRSGIRAIYRLDIRPERPDFSLFLVGSDEYGSGVTVPRGGHHELRVACLRHDGFDGEISLQVEGLPPGVRCEPQVIGPRVTDAVLVVSAAGDAPLSAGTILVKGTARIADAEVVREAHASTLVWPTTQKNIPAMSRLARAVHVAVGEKPPFTLAVKANELSAPVGGKLEVAITLARNWPDVSKTAVQITRIAAASLTNGQPINIPNLTIAAGKTDGVVKFQLPANTVPGTYNLVWQGKGKFSYQPDPKSKQKKNVEGVAVTPPIRLVVYNTVADLTPASPEVVVPPGGETALVVRIKRLHGYKGPFKLDLVPASGVQVSASSVTVPAGANEIRVVLKAPKGARPTSSPSAILRATATVNGVSLRQETKFRITVRTAEAAAAPGASVKSIVLLKESSDGWKYRAATGIQGDGWTVPKFDDRAWTTARTPIGYGEGELSSRKGTTIALTGQDVLFRRVVDVPADLHGKPKVQFRLAVASDNSAVVFVNSQRVDEDPEADHEYRYWNREIALTTSQLRPGANVIAVRVKNTAGSSDLYFDLQVTAGIPGVVTSKK